MAKHKKGGKKNRRTKNGNKNKKGTQIILKQKFVQPETKERKQGIIASLFEWLKGKAAL